MAAGKDNNESLLGAIRVEGVLCLLACVFLVIFMPSAVFPQDVEPQTGTQWTVDVGALMLSPGMAWSIGPNWRLGWGLGVGDDMFGFMAVGGNHYSEPDWWSYEDRDGATDKDLYDIVHAKVFARVEPYEKWHLDIGLHGSVFLHFDSSDDDAGSGISVAAYALPMYGWRHFKFGPRIVAGYFGGCSDASEFGVKVSPLIMRITFG